MLLIKNLYVPMLVFTSDEMHCAVQLSFNSVALLT